MLIHHLSCLKVERQLRKGAFLAHKLNFTWSKFSWGPQCSCRSRLRRKDTSGVPVVLSQILVWSIFLWGAVLFLCNLCHTPKCLSSDYAKTRYLRNNIRTGTMYAVIFPWYFPSLWQFQAQGLSEPDIKANIVQYTFLLWISLIIFGSMQTFSIYSVLFQIFRWLVWFEVL